MNLNLASLYTLSETKVAAKYRMVLVLDTVEIEIPVLPKELKINSKGNNEKAEIIELGEINILRDKRLRTLGWDSFFPAHMAPYVANYESNLSSLPIYGSIANIHDAPKVNPMKLVEAIQEHRDSKKPCLLVMVGTELAVDFWVGIEDFDYREKAGEVGDIYYSIELKEWKEYTPIKIKLSGTQQDPKIDELDQKRYGTPGEVIDIWKTKNEINGTHTVSSGETLWQVAKKIYDDGTRYLELYNRNKQMIDGANVYLDVFRYTLHAGQVLMLP